MPAYPFGSKRMGEFVRELARQGVHLKSALRRVHGVEFTQWYLERASPIQLDKPLTRVLFNTTSPDEQIDKMLKPVMPTEVRSICIALNIDVTTIDGYHLG